MNKPSEADNVLRVVDPATQTGALKRMGGSNSDTWNTMLANQVLDSLWTKYSGESYKNLQREGTVAGLVGIAPQDELEGMIAVQLIAAHHAAMECYRRAMLPEQTFQGRNEALSQANKLSRTYATLLEALNRHRGKGQQKVTVEHVHVHSGGQAVVGVVAARGGGDQAILKEQPHAKSIGHEPQQTVWCEDKEREVVQSARNAQRPMPHARGIIPRSSEGE